MNTKATTFLITVLSALGLAHAAADPIGSAFTWQGRLSVAGNPANGLYDLKLVLNDAATNGTSLGTNTLSAVPVSNGLYNVVLDFGPSSFDGNARWLELSVRTNTAGTWTLLSPRLAMTATPYALHSTLAGGVSGILSDAQLSANIPRLNGPNTFTGPITAPRFSGDGSGLGGIAPASGSPNYISKAGGTMTGTLNLPADGLVAGGSQLVLSGGNVGIGAPNPTVKLEVAGNLRVSGLGNSITTPILSITGGSDVAEPFAMSGGTLAAGSVVIIDPSQPGRLKLSEQAYDKRVAGVVSGAGGVQPGLTLRQQGVLEAGQNVALTGRVFVLADATGAPIEPGDLLTTAPLPGHAMKVTDFSKAQGAILGKAMSRLDSGRGLVLVLVTLQ